MNSFGVRILLILLVGAGLAAAVYYSPAYLHRPEPERADRLKTGGSSVVYFVMDKWKNGFKGASKDKTDVSYSSIGSTEGIANMIDGTFDIAFTSAPMSDKQKEAARAKGGEVVHIPLLLSAIVPIYNVKELKGKPPLNFTGDVLAGIFMGTIDKWNHPEIQKINKGVELPDVKIEVVHREGPSGTTYVFTDYLTGASETWAKEFGPAQSDVKWPRGVGKKRNHELAAHVYRTEGAIGYVEMFYALTTQLPYGAVQNADKTAFLHAQHEYVTEAASAFAADVSDEQAFKLVNKPGAKSYPICSIDYAVCYVKQPEAKKKMVLEFLTWVTHEGQEVTKDSLYAPLPEGLVHRADEKLKLITAK
jgi:phosphate transport system substrate-binding protein